MDQVQINDLICRMEEMLGQLAAYSVAVTGENRPVMVEVQCDLANMQACFKALEVRTPPMWVSVLHRPAPAGASLGAAVFSSVSPAAWSLVFWGLNVGSPDCYDGNL